MTKAELIERVYKDNKLRGLPRVAIAEMVDSVFDLLAKGIMKDGKFTYPGFGAFNLKKRKERKGRNPQTGKTITIKAHKTITFRPAPTLKQSLR